MHPVPWCNASQQTNSRKKNKSCRYTGSFSTIGCTALAVSSDLRLHNHDYCKMSSEERLQLPLNFYITILGIGLFILILTFIFCCYMFRLRRQGAGEQYGYNEVVLKRAGKKLSLIGQTCAVCLEEFGSRDELGVCPCSHSFHKKCLLKWLEIRSVCPMCNKPICRLRPDPPSVPEPFQDLLVL